MTKRKGAHGVVDGGYRRTAGRPKGRVWDAYQALETQLRKHLGRDDVRTRLVDYTMKIGRWGDAVEHIQTLLKTDPDNVELLTKLGTCFFALDRNREAQAEFLKSLEKDPKQVDAYALLATILRDAWTSRRRPTN